MVSLPLTCEEHHFVSHQMQFPLFCIIQKSNHSLLMGVIKRSSLENKKPKTSLIWEAVWEKVCFVLPKTHLKWFARNALHSDRTISARLHESLFHSHYYFTSQYNHTLACEIKVALIPLSLQAKYYSFAFNTISANKFWQVLHKSNFAYFFIINPFMCQIT